MHCLCLPFSSSLFSVPFLYLSSDVLFGCKCVPVKNCKCIVFIMLAVNLWPPWCHNIHIYGQINAGHLWLRTHYTFSSVAPVPQLTSLESCLRGEKQQRWVEEAKSQVRGTFPHLSLFIIATLFLVLSWTISDIWSVSNVVLQLELEIHVITEICLDWWVIFVSVGAGDLQ